jgi:hypothetical protein
MTRFPNTQQVPGSSQLRQIHLLVLDLRDAQLDVDDGRPGTAVEPT